MAVEVPHFALPFRFEIDTNGEAHAAVNEQDSIEDITACVESILRTPLGYREELPDFGVRDQTFSEGGIDVDEIQAAVAQWEPRADALIEEDESYLDQLISIARVTPRKVTVLTPTPEEEVDLDG